MKVLRALRGAVCVENDAGDIRQKTELVYDALLEKNGLAESDVVSLVFSLTPDLDAKNPAAALRDGGRAGSLALFCVQEAFIKGGLPRTIRLLLHCNMEETTPLHHVYTAGAEKLRPEYSIQD
jgi:chorismate mutase